MPARSSRVHPAACRVDPDHPVNAPLYRQRDVRHGPRALACVALLAIAGCTSKSAPAPTDEATPARADAPTSGSKEAPASQPASAPVLIADFSAPVSGAGATASVYDDGVAIVSWSEGIGKGPPILRRFELRPDEVDHLRRLTADPKFLEAKAAYHQEGVLDGSATTFVAGGRRIVVVNRPLALPAPLEALSTWTHDLFRQVDGGEGSDAFAGDDPIVVVHKRRFRDASFGDALTVFADGRLDYRITYGDVPSDPDVDYPFPQATLRSVAPAELRALREAVGAPALRALPQVIGEAERERG
ncbi:MAG: hypothetical protein KC486_04525, partial [Myxococcales bacterium]|nr:hypothetical protein [Myxococcales bacterium]